MIQEIKKPVITTISILVLIYIALCASIIYYYQLSVIVSILLVLSGGGAVMVINPFLKPLLKRIRAKELIEAEKELKLRLKHVQIAESNNKKGFNLPLKNPKHLVYEENLFKALHFYAKSFAPLIKEDDKTIFFYITPGYNNIYPKK